MPALTSLVTPPALGCAGDAGFPIVPPTAFQKGDPPCPFDPGSQTCKSPALLTASSGSGVGRRAAGAPHFSCLPAEVLEVRSLLSSYTAASVSALVADINAANANGGANTITLAANTTFDLTAVNNTTNGANGLPVIGGKNGADNLTIIGNGATIDRSTAAGTPAFRLFDVANGNSLTLAERDAARRIGARLGALRQTAARSLTRAP